MDCHSIMKFLRLVPSLALFQALLACTPIAPSIHKSVLRSGDSQRVLPQPSPSGQAPQVSQRLSSENKESQLEIRWIRDDEQLSEELDSDRIFELKKLGIDEIARLRKEGFIRLSPFEEAHEESGTHSSLAIRIILRVQMSEERLQEKVAAESWRFGWEDDSRRVLAISHSDPKADSKGQVAEALVSVHVVTEKKSK